MCIFWSKPLVLAFRPSQSWPHLVLPASWQSWHSPLPKPIKAVTRFIHPERMKGWVGLVGWPVAHGSPTVVVIHQLQVERRIGEVRRPETYVLPLCHATCSRWFAKFRVSTRDWAESVRSDEMRSVKMKSGEVR